MVGRHPVASSDYSAPPCTDSDRSSKAVGSSPCPYILVGRREANEMGNMEQGIKCGHRETEEIPRRTKGRTDTKIRKD